MQLFLKFFFKTSTDCEHDGNHEIAHIFDSPCNNIYLLPNAHLRFILNGIF